MKLYKKGQQRITEIAVLAALVVIFQIPTSSLVYANPYPVGNVSILPVIFIPNDKNFAARRWLNKKSRKNVYAYLQATQDKWQQLLGGQTTFKMQPLFIANGSKPGSFYANAGSPAAAVQQEILPQIGVSTSDVMSQAMCNYNHILLVLVVGAEFTVGTGGPWCSYANRSGPGAAFVGLDSFFNQGKLTSTLVHEVGHGLGLVHSWERPSKKKSKTSALSLYAQETSNSVMSYNSANQSNSTNGKSVPGTLLPVERFELAHNKRALPDYYFSGALIHPEYSTFFRHPLNINSFANSKYDRNTMWQSPNANPQGWVSLGLTLPTTKALNRIVVYTGYSINKRRADVIQIERRSSSTGEYVFVAKAKASDGSTVLNFPLKAAKEWKISLHAKDGDSVVFRGARFFRVKGSSEGASGLLAKAVELYPPKLQ